MIPAPPENKAIGRPDATKAPLPPGDWYSFNFNDYVRFRPTAGGMEIWREYWRETERIVGSPYPFKVDADGWATEQLHQVIRIFGPHFLRGFDSPIEMNFEIRRTF